jgi:multidrug efflux pump subunit AcrB
MVGSRVAPNLLMLFLIVGGLFVTTRIKQEVFPAFELDMVTVSVPYPGASPEEVEQGVVLPIEEAVRGLEGIEEVSAKASENLGVVRLELLSDSDKERTQQEIQQAVDQIRTFPLDAEEPTVSLVARRRGVLRLVLYGNTSERTLRELAEEVRDRLLTDPQITQVEVVGGRAFELHVEVPEDELRAHRLTLQQIAQRLAAGSVELPGGSIKTKGGELLVRVRDRRDWAQQFAEVPIATLPGGSVVKLGDIAKVNEGFEDVERYARFDDQPSISIDVFRVGEQTPIGVSDAAREVMLASEATLPDGIRWEVRNDRSDYYRGRLSLLVKNATLGLILVLIVLGLFLELRLAFWVTMGIPTSFLGALVFLLGMDVSINIISMFAFIVALGIVVDDAIVAGENIYEYRRRGMSFVQAAIQGAKDVAVPIAVSILSNIIAFLPLLFVPGTLGKVWKVIPVVTITVFIISWVESLLVLPAHLAHAPPEPANPGPLRRLQQRCARGLERFVERVYAPFVNGLLRWRWLTMALGLAALIVAWGYVAGGRIGVILMPRVESDVSVVTAVLPVGSPAERVESVRRQLSAAARDVAAEHGGHQLSRGVYSQVENNTVEVTMYLTEPEVRPMSTTAVTKLWRKRVGAIAGLRSMRFEADRGGPGSGAALTIELSHRDIPTLERASKALAARLSEFPNVTDVDDGRNAGKRQLDFRLLPAGASLGLTSTDIGRQVRNSFYGAIALRQQRQRNELTVLVRRPEQERASEYDIETLMIRTPSGSDVPLREVAEVVRGRSFTDITRRDAPKSCVRSTLACCRSWASAFQG